MRPRLRLVHSVEVKPDDHRAISVLIVAPVMFSILVLLATVACWSALTDMEE